MRIPRSENKQSTDAEQAKRNWMNSYKHFRRKVHANFGRDDLFVTFDFRDEVDFENAVRLFKNFLQRLRRWRGNRGLGSLRYMGAVVDEQRGARVRTHIHVAMSGMSMDTLAAMWTCGNATLEHFDTAKDYTRLTAYIESQIKKRDGHKRWMQSRNLVHPIVERKQITRSLAERILSTPKGCKQIEQRVDVNENGRYQYLCYCVLGMTAEDVRRKMRRLYRRQERMKQ